MSSSAEESLDSLSDEYQRLRVVEGDEPFEAVVDDVFWVSDQHIGLLVDVAGEQRIVRARAWTSIDNWESDCAVSTLLSEWGVSEDGTYSVDGLVGQSLPLQFEPGLNACTIPHCDGEFPVTVPEEEVPPADDGEARDFGDLEQLYNTQSEYLNQKDEEGWKVPVDRVEGQGDDDGFAIVVSAPVEAELRWSFDAPETTDPAQDDAARLIELVGQGRVDFIEGEYVYIVAESDTDRHLKTVATDETGSWALVTPNDLDEWGERREAAQSESNSTTSSSRTTSSTRSRTRRSSNLRSNGLNLIIHGLALMLTVSFADVVIESMLTVLPTAESAVTAELLSIITSMTDVLMLFGPLMMAAGICMYGISSGQR